MFSRRLTTCLARFVLAWFVLHVGAGVAAPVVNPQALQVVCAGSGLKLVPGGDGDAQVVAGGLDCPLCSPALAPPPAPAAMPLLQAAPPLVVAQPESITLAASPVPPPARGPPVALPA
ncbi:hypothetical protein LZ009_18825 [Ramlibacter sp. XY19]|uniref:hypothetical protein n=1 Tax=Ramlibacter paludis TaxID=2908000 RepID=UPI0023DB7481|nr:hypothetical protein [Ramlibacter paludis]MCG2594838.1 hypothetical protein [Ramlibacter paludis]